MEDMARSAACAGFAVDCRDWHTNTAGVSFEPGRNVSLSVYLMSRLYQQAVDAQPNLCAVVPPKLNHYGLK